MNPVVVIAIIIAVAVFLFIWNKISPAATALLIILALYGTGLVAVNTLFSSFVNSSTLLVLNMFVICGAATKAGITRDLGKWLLRFAKTERTAAVLLMLVTIVFSSFFSNMATTAMMVPIVYGICQVNPEYRSGKLLLPVAFGAGLGGLNTVVGSVGNAMARSVLQEAGYSGVGFFSFAKIGIPVSILGILFMYFIGYRMLPESRTIDVDVNVDSASGTVEAIVPWKRTLAIIVFVLVMIGMMLESVIGVPVHITSLVGVVILIVSGVLSDKEAFAMVNWPTIIFFGGLLALSSAITASGLDNLIADWIVKVLGSASNVYIICGVIFVVMSVATQVMSNGALLAIFLPIGISISEKIGCNPVAIIMLINVASSCSFATPMATPLNAYVMGIGKLKFVDFFKSGIVLTLLCGVLCVLLLPTLWPL